ncbi:regulator of protease activity HflC (stomatin/prohibitin superfamily) [Larkinella arboricola]|uniref:Regulator of protease activity HflC (Stomatin/prohibitin superfamily) n=1 Tax=Larkinella arboricola TaxID=643671 RepID=A0A327WUK9_LARAB|nr:slipin family protein [Larkinella arboricola]RAJ96024.1 regulator of protease activity HflC (stomatin/prohibitin superfamily) [Larkinella arboricola]
MGYVFLTLAFLALVVVFATVKVVPQQTAYVVERLGKFFAVLQPGVNFIIPFFDRVAYKHSLKETALDIPEQICITRDNVQVRVDGVIFIQIIDPMKASYGISDYKFAVSQLSQTTMRSEMGKIELDKTFEERTTINQAVVHSIDEAAIGWGVKVLRYEIKNITPPQTVLNAMEKQMQAEREKRAVILESEGQKQSAINIAEGQKQKVVLESEGIRLRQINEASGQAEAIKSIADATAESIRKIAVAIQEDGGMNAVQLRVAEQVVSQFGNLARTNNTLILPANFGDLSSIISTAMTVVKQQEKTV